MSTKTDPADAITIGQVRRAMRRQSKLVGPIDKGRVLSVRRVKGGAGYIAGFDLGPELQFDSAKSKIARGATVADAIDNLLS